MLPFAADTLGPLCSKAKSFINKLGSYVMYNATGGKNSISNSIMYLKFAKYIFQLLANAPFQLLLKISFKLGQ